MAHFITNARGEMQVSERWVREAYAALATSMMAKEPLAPAKEIVVDDEDTVLLPASLVVEIEEFWTTYAGQVLKASAPGIISGGQDLCDAIEEWVDAIGPVVIYTPGLTDTQKQEYADGGMDMLRHYPDPRDPARTHYQQDATNPA